jgi:ubiquinone/menaquinone biosynthesis C-methylase UbiE
VLEIGFGTGVNLSYYEPQRVNRLYALEPNGAMIRLAQRHPRRDAFDMLFLRASCERVPLPDAVVDTVVSTFTLCSISGDLSAVMGNIARTLRPGGKLIFLENTVSLEHGVRRWQKWSRPVSRILFSGLELERDIPSLIKMSGFTLDRVDSTYLARFPKSWCHCCWGIATSNGG